MTEFPSFACQRRLAPGEWIEQERKLSKMYEEAIVLFHQINGPPAKHMMKEKVG